MTVNLPDYYAEELNKILTSPGRIEDKLFAAVNTYENIIQKSASVVLFEPESETCKTCSSARDLTGSVTQALSQYDCLKLQFEKLAPTAIEIYLDVKPHIVEINRLFREIRLLELPGFVAYYDSAIDAARLLDDRALLADAIRRYLSFIDSEVANDADSLKVICKHSVYHENCFDALNSLLSDFANLLDEINFPIHSSGCAPQEKCSQPTIDDEQRKTFADHYRCLSSFNISHLNRLLEKPISTIIPLPMQIILSGLEKRFRYHFTGERKTNRLDKPEWYMARVLQWIRENDNILTILDRDFFEDLGRKRQFLKVEFIRGLVTLLMDKLESDLGLTSGLHPPRYLIKLELHKSTFDATSGEVSTVDKHTHTQPQSSLLPLDCFGHFIDIILQTDARLSQLGYPADQPRPSNILSRPEVFSRWLKLEHRLAMDRLEAVLLSHSAWTVVDEENKRPQCADDLVALLHALSIRSRQLTNRMSQARFFRVQLELLRVFLSRLCQEAHSVDRLPVFGLWKRLTGVAGIESQPTVTPSSHWFPIINSLFHLREVMLQFADDQYYIVFWEDENIRAFLQIPDPWMVDLGLQTSEQDLTQENDDGEGAKKRGKVSCAIGVQSSRSTHGSTQTYAHGGAFNTVLRRYEEEIDRMLEVTVDTVVAEFTAHSRDYVNAAELWMRAGLISGPSGGMTVDSMELSGTASELLVTIRNSLFHLSNCLYWKLFNRIWQRIARCLDDFLFYKLIRSNRFTPYGAAQLRFDLRHCLFPLFGAYSDQRADVYFPLCRDACILLNLPAGSAELLQSTLSDHLSCRAQQTDGRNNPLGPLLELGIYALTADEALIILDSRSLPK